MFHKRVTRANKYGNKSVVIDGVTFASKKEGKRYEELKALQQEKVICRLAVHPSFILLRSVKWSGKTLRQIKYVADFSYQDNESGQWTVEDVKGFRTDVYKLKRHMMIIMYPSILFKET